MLQHIHSVFPVLFMDYYYYFLYQSISIVFRLIGTVSEAAQHLLKHCASRDTSPLQGGAAEAREACPGPSSAPLWELPSRSAPTRTSLQFHPGSASHLSLSWRP